MLCQVSRSHRGGWQIEARSANLPMAWSQAQKLSLFLASWLLPTSGPSSRHHATGLYRTAMGLHWVRDPGSQRARQPAC